MRARSGGDALRRTRHFGLEPHEIVRAGIGFVPQGRRLWPSLSVDETLRLSERAGAGGHSWTVERVYSTFPRLAERRNNGGGQLSGGEQQMLAISRALLEQSAPAGDGRADRGARAVDRRPGARPVAATCQRGGPLGARRRTEHRRRDLRLRLRRDHGQRPDQPHHGRGRTRRATAICSNDCSASAGTARRRSPRRVRPRARARATAKAKSPGVARRRRRTTARRSIGRTVCRTVGVVRGAPAKARGAGDGRDGSRDRSSRSRSPSASGAPRWWSAPSTPRAPNCASSATGCARCGIPVRTVDLSTSGKISRADVTPTQVAAMHPSGSSAVFSGDRGESVTAMAEAFGRWIERERGIGGVISAGGSGGTSLATAGMRAAAARHPEDHGFDRRLRRRRPLCRLGRYHDDAFRRRRAGPQSRSPSRCSATPRTRSPA